MAVVTGEDFTLEVETATPGTFVPVAEMNKYSDTSSRGSTRYNVFGANPHEVSGKPSEEFAVSGYHSTDDVGQARLVAMKIANTPVKIRVLPDGTNGFTQLVTVLEATHGADADPETLQERSFKFKGIADRVKVLTGGGLVP